MIESTYKSARNLLWRAAQIRPKPASKPTETGTPDTLSSAHRDACHRKEYRISLISYALWPGFGRTMRRPQQLGATGVCNLTVVAQGNPGGGWVAH